MTDVIRKSIELKAPIARVWEALTDSQQFGAWFRVALEGPFEVGTLARGRITHAGYEHVTWEARVVQMDAPTTFAFTWRPYAIDPDKDYSAEQPTRVEFRLEDLGERTRLTLTESGFDAIPAERRDTAFRMNDGGWTAQMENIRAHVER